jgi:ribosomal protein S3
VRPEILGIGAPQGVREGALGMEVQKSGRTTGHTTGRITQIDVTVQVDYEGQTVTFVDQFMATAMSQGGDSGSAVLDMEGYVTGLLFAGSEMATLINPIQLVLQELDVELVTA